MSLKNKNVDIDNDNDDLMTEEAKNKIKQ